MFELTMAMMPASLLSPVNGDNDERHEYAENGMNGAAGCSGNGGPSPMDKFEEAPRESQVRQSPRKNGIVLIHLVL